MSYDSLLLPNNLLRVRLVLILVSFVTNDWNLLIFCQLPFTPLCNGVDIQNAEVHVEELEKSHNLIASGANNERRLQIWTLLYSEIE